jgi:hypothetical protein
MKVLINEDPNRGPGWISEISAETGHALAFIITKAHLSR